MYTKDDCIWCEKLKQLLTDLDEKYTEFNVEDDRQHLKFLKDSGFKTVPQVFYNGFYIGDYEKTKEHLQEQ